MKFVHSFWSKPLLNNKFGDLELAIIHNLVEFALSVKYIRENGYDIDLYTDEIGSKILGDLPYTQIHLINNNITDNYHFAASMKFEAMKQMDLGDVHIDGDIFLNKGKGFSLIEHNTSDLLTSFFESKKTIRIPEDKLSELLNSVKLGTSNSKLVLPEVQDLSGWYNTSITKFNNADFKEAYIKNYETLVKGLENKIFDSSWPDVILEQLQLTSIEDYKQYNIEPLIKDYGSEEALAYATKIGFTHLGNIKSIIHNNLVLILKTQFPEYAKELENKLQDLKQEFNLIKE